MAEQYESDSELQNEVLAEDRTETPDYWRKFIKKNKQAADEHWKMAKAAWREYECGKARSYLKTTDRTNEAPSFCPIYWSSCKTMESAYYARTPKLYTDRRFGIRDDNALTQSLIVERLGEYLVDRCDFDEVMSAAVGDFIHAGKATTQVVYEYDDEETEIRVPLQPGEFEGEFIGPEGPYLDEVFQDEQGFFGKSISIEPQNKRIILKQLPFDEILHNKDAKSNYEANERAYHFRLDREEAEERFPEAAAKGIQWKSGKSEKDDDSYDEDANKDCQYLEGWECHCKKSGKVYWISEQYKQGFLDKSDDYMGLMDFFPSPDFIISSKPRDSLYPTPVYVQLLPYINEMHDIHGRIKHLIRGIRRRFLVDGSCPELEAAINDAEETEFITIDNLTNILEKGGLQNMIWAVPVQELVSAIGELNSLKEQFKQEFYEYFGLPDILRGETDPLDAEGTNILKATSASDRFRVDKKQVAKLAEESIQMMIDLALQVFDDAEIAQIVGYQYMDEADQQRFPLALQAARDDKERFIRIKVETDSLSFVDQQLKARATAEATRILNEGLQQIVNVLQIDPAAGAVGLKALLMSLETLNPGREFIDEVEQLVNSLIEKAKAAAENPPEPLPDYEMLKVQIEQGKLQNDQIKLQLDGAKQQLEQYKAEVETQEKARKLGQDDFKNQLEAQRTGAETQLELQRIQIESMGQQLEEIVQHFMMQIEAQRLEIEKFKAQMQAGESRMEEIRLAREVDAKIIEASKPPVPSEPKEPSQININVAPPASEPEPTPYLDPITGAVVL